MEYRNLFLSLLFLPLFSFNMQHPVLIVVGTRPEGIKMIPVYRALKDIGIPVALCSTDQHTQLLSDDVFKIFQVQPDYNFNIMKPNQDLFYVTSAVLEQMKDLLLRLEPCLVLVQGDTTSAMAAALAAFYLKIPIGHIEAGLRTGNKYGPFPEEVNRTFIDTLATFHFVPTDLSAENLTHENIKSDSIYCVGNTVVDALHSIKAAIDSNTITVCESIKTIIDTARMGNKKLVLLTAHRRESFNGGLLQIFTAIKEVLEKHPELLVVYPVHPNPAIQESLHESGLADMPNSIITKPIGYSDLVYLLHAVDLIATDSGGIQEEGVSLGKPVLVLRNETDRPEGVYSGVAQLVGTDKEKIIDVLEFCLKSHKSFTKNSIYGDGTAGIQIAEIIKEYVTKQGIL